MNWLCSLSLITFCLVVPPQRAIGERNKATKMLRRAFLSLACTFVILIVLLFLPAGNIVWAEGWIFLAIFFGEIIVGCIYLWFKNPEIYLARSRIHPGTTLWDKSILFFLFILLVAIFPVAGLDSRFHWSTVPGWLMILGYVLFSIGMWLSIWAEGVNRSPSRACGSRPNVY
jgi:hypothetical protein